jgi:hypothetical protein
MRVRILAEPLVSVAAKQHVREVAIPLVKVTATLHVEEVAMEHAKQDVLGVAQEDVPVLVVNYVMALAEDLIEKGYLYY